MNHARVQWHACEVRLDQGKRPTVRTAADVLQPGLVILADGMFSRSRARAGMPWMWHSYGEQALQAVLQPAMPHGQAARQWFTEEGPMALLPLAHGKVALVWSVPASYAQQLMTMPEEMFCRLVSRASHWELGACRLVSQRLAQPLACAMAMPIAAPGVVAIGDAAHVVHPLAGQGVNLGFGDADALAGCINESRNRNLDCGDALVLRTYHNRRLWQQGTMLAGCHGLHALFASPLAPWASAGLGVVDRLFPLKRFLARTATGRHGFLQSRESVAKA
jgi:ubiquinone biosynthesis UbiH/UbiF/VisC/COQ6 family hydroxylase